MDQRTNGKQRNIGLELLRMVCMLMVVVLHVLGQGGVMIKTGTNGAAYYTCYALEIICLCAVNCYGLLSGYVGVHARFRVRRLLSMVLTVELYSVLIGLALGLAHPAWIDRDMLLKIMLPVQWKTWWYYSAYIGLYFFMPFLNRGVKALLPQERQNLLTAVFMVFCVLPMTAKAFNVDFFSLVGGYSLIWLMILYVFGAALRLLEDERKAFSDGLPGTPAVPAGRTSKARFQGGEDGESDGTPSRAALPAGRASKARFQGEEDGASDGTPSRAALPESGSRSGLWERVLALRIPALLLIFACSSALSWLWKLLVETRVILPPADSQLQRMLLIYHSPTIFINGLALLLIFRQVSVREGHPLRTAIHSLAPSAFYVYIMHTHPLIWTNVLKEAFAGWRNLPAPLVLLPVIGAALVIYLVCSGVDAARRTAAARMRRLLA